MTGDKILTDIIFKDGYYLTIKNFEGKVVKKKEIAIEERAYELVKDWYVTKKRCFLPKDSTGTEHLDKNIDTLGKEMGDRYDGYVAFIIEPLRSLLNNNGFDFEQITRAWNRKGYTECDKGRNQKAIRGINSTVPIKCVVLNMNKTDEIEEDIDLYDMSEDMELPF